MPPHPRRRGTERAEAKLTRSLRVLGRRPDGYHLIEAEMVSVDLADRLDLAPCEDSGGPDPGAGPRDALEVIDAVAWRGASPGAGTAPPGCEVPSGGANLVVKALALAGASARVRLTKRIPAGAGLGGGSSDAAAVLRFFEVLDPDLAVRLGADVPFCLRGGRALVRGIGEQIEPLDFQPAAMVLCTPAIAVSTAEVYRAFDEVGPGRRAGTNDLEAAAISVEPELVRFRDLVAEVAGEPPTLAGSGSTWFVELPEGAAAAVCAGLGAALVEVGARASVSLVHTTEGAVGST